MRKNRAFRSHASLAIPPDQTLTAPFSATSRAGQLREGQEPGPDRATRVFRNGNPGERSAGPRFDGLGLDADLWLYSVSASDGFRFHRTGPARLGVGLRADGYGPLDRYAVSGSIRYYDHHNDDRTLTFVSLAGDILKDPTPLGLGATPACADIRVATRPETAAWCSTSRNASTRTGYPFA